MEGQTNEQIAIRVSLLSIIINILLSVFKMIAGILSKSGAMVSDAVHSFSDVFSTFVVIVGVKISNKEKDNKHPYGHERFESAAAILLATILFITGLGIGYSGIMKVMSDKSDELTVPGSLALIAAIISIITKEAMYWYARNAAKKINSGALMADAWHHRSDALSSVGSFIGIFGARLGMPVLDPIASVVICFFIVKVAVSIFIDSINKMTDKSCDEMIVEEMKTIILTQNGVLGIDQIKTRLFGDRIYVDVEICADGKDTLNSTHEIAQRTHDAIEKNFPKVKHCMVHVSPVNVDALIDIQ